MNEKPVHLDHVRHKLQRDIVGVVNANYTIDGVDYIDVEITTQNIYYKSPAENWEVVIGDPFA